ILGYMEWNVGLAAAGTWASGPTKIQLFGPGIKKPGDVVQKVYASTSSQASTNSTSFSDTGFSATLTVQSAPNLVQIRISVNGALCDTPLQAGSVRLVRGTTTVLTMSTNSLAFSSAGSSTSNQTNEFLDAPQAVGSTTYKTQFAASSSGVTFFL